jgi:hypothetical protein
MKENKQALIKLAHSDSSMKAIKWVGDSCIVGNFNAHKLCALMNEKNEEKSIVSTTSSSSIIGSGACVLGEQLLKL